jgi:hypothetical protein
MADSLPPPQRGPQTTLDWARLYAGLGWSVVPVRRGEKIPAVAWARYQQQPADDAQLAAWFGEGGMGLGLVQGQRAGTIVLDFDASDGGMDTLAQLEARGLPVSVRAFTPGGGVHVVLRHPGMHIPTRKRILPGLDVRGDGGFIVACPSVHASSRQYAWDVDAHPEDAPVADCPGWLISHLVGAAPVAPGGAGDIIRAAAAGGPLGMPAERVTDGREGYMRDTILAVCGDLRRRLGRLPSETELFEAAWPQYAAKVDFTRPGRGAAEFGAKVRYTLARVEAGRVRGFSEAPASVAHDPETGEIIGLPPPKQGPRLMTIAEIEAMPPPEWLIAGLIPEQGLVVPYGPPKAGKTFLVLSMALHIAAGKDWFGRAVKQGAVVYIAGEGLGGLALRIKAMRARYEISADVPFYVRPKAVNFRDPQMVAELVALVRETVGNQRVALVVIDTLARAMPGADENSAQEVGLVIAQCDLVKEHLRATVAPIHHTGKDQERGMRGSNAIHGAVDATFRIKAAGKGRVSMVNEDQKDGEPAPPMTFDMETVSVGLGRSSLVPVLDTPARGRPKAEAPDAEEMLTRVAIAMQGQREAPLRRIAEALNIETQGRPYAEFSALIPAGADRATTLRLGAKRVRVWKRIAGEHRTAPIFVVMEDTDEG